MRNGVTLLFLLLAVNTYGQKSTLIQNIDFRAKGLSHSLNKTGDSLILESNKTIYKVEIFNSNFEKKFNVSNNKIKIPLNKIPVGRFITEVKLPGKLVVITLLRHQPLPLLNEYYTSSKPTPEAAMDENIMSITEPNIKKTKVPQPKKVVRFYWIVNHINKGNGSSKMTRLGEKDIVDRLIRQNKIDLKTRAGRLNKLTIWEVYDTSKFMRFKRRNPDYANAEDVDFFNTSPIYDSSSKQ
jgi:hypothetical protein